MTPRLFNQISRLLIKLQILAIIFIFIRCTDTTQLSGTVDKTDAGIVAMLYNPDGSPAIGVDVKIFKVTDTTKTPVSEVLSDDNGNYSVGGLAKGIYNVYAEKGELVAFQDSINVLKDTVIIEDDTLETPIKLSGVIGLQVNHDPRTVTVQVLGTDIYSNVNEDGLFTLNRMAKGDFTLKLSTTLDNYTTTYENFSIDADTPDTLSDTLPLIYTGIPVVEGLSATYDTLNGVVTLSWKSTKYRDLQDYLIYRDYFDSLNMSSTPLFFTDDTVFHDSIFDKTKTSGEFSFSDSNDYHFKYRVSVRNNSQEEGLSYKYIGIITASPVKVKTEISVASYHIAKGVMTGSSSINDSIRFTINLSNHTRELCEIKYTDLNNDSVLAITAIDSTKEFEDTLNYLWETTGEKKIEISVLDLGGTLWRDTITFQVVTDVPDIAFTETLVYLNVPFSLTGNDRFGVVESLSVDTSRYVQFENISDSVIQITVSDTLTNDFTLNCTIKDDDGNLVNKSFTFRTGLQWEKKADSFLDSSTIRSVVELNNTLFVFAASSSGKNYSSQIYSSVDGETWNEISAAIPWSNWCTKPTVHNNRIFLMEGVSDSADTNKIWYSNNGSDWESKNLDNFPKWFSSPSFKLPTGQSDPLELVFISYRGKLWAGSLYFYGDNVAAEFYDDNPNENYGCAEFYNSQDGFDWIDVIDQYSPQYVYPDPTDYIIPTAKHYLTMTNKVLYLLEWDIGNDQVNIYETFDFATHERICYFNRPDRLRRGAEVIPIPIQFMDKIFLCSSEASYFGEYMFYLNPDGSVIDSEFSYPGSINHSCIVFKNKLYSISNNGVYATK